MSSAASAAARGIKRKRDEPDEPETPTWQLNYTDPKATCIQCSALITQPPLQPGGRTHACCRTCAHDADEEEVAANPMSKKCLRCFGSRSVREVCVCHLCPSCRPRPVGIGIGPTPTQ